MIVLCIIFLINRTIFIHRIIFPIPLNLGCSDIYLALSELLVFLATLLFFLLWDSAVLYWDTPQAIFSIGYNGILLIKLVRSLVNVISVLRYMLSAGKLSFSYAKRICGRHVSYIAKNVTLTS